MKAQASYSRKEPEPRETTRYTSDPASSQTLWPAERLHGNHTRVPPELDKKVTLAPHASTAFLMKVRHQARQRIAEAPPQPLSARPTLKAPLLY